MPRTRGDAYARAAIEAHIKDCSEFRKSIDRRFDEQARERERMHDDNQRAFREAKERLSELQDAVVEGKNIEQERQVTVRNKVITVLLSCMATLALGIAGMAWYVMTHGGAQ